MDILNKVYKCAMCRREWQSAASFTSGSFKTPVLERDSEVIENK